MSAEGQGGFTNHPVDDAMTDTRITFLGGKEGEWNSTK
ncbi:hypothetical protein V1291_003981 [Nitrobacteraceae bacterium AZCC 1564]